MADEKELKIISATPSEIDWDEMGRITQCAVEDMLRNDLYYMFTPDPSRVPYRWPNVPPDGKGDIIDIKPVPDPPKELL